MTRFLWLDINASYSHSSLAFPALHAQIPAAVLKNTRWKRVSGTPKTHPSEIISSVTAFKPHYIFATAWLFNIATLKNLLCRIKALQNRVRIILGGPEFLGDNEDFLRENRFADAVFKGEGEEIFPLLIEKTVCGAPGERVWESLPGFEYLRPDGSYRLSNAITVRNFAALVPPEKSRFFNWEKAFVQLETSRGCFNRCRFCVSGIDSSPVRNLPPGNVRERLRKIYKKGIREVRILDRTFNAQPRRAAALLEIFREFTGKIRFHIEVHPALLNDTLKEVLSSLPEGLLHIEAGLQSLDEKVIERCRRSGNTRHALEGLEYLLRLRKFEVHTDLIAGLPGYTYERLLHDTVELAAIGPHEIQLELLKLLPGTWFRKNSRRQGLAYSPAPPYEVLRTKSISHTRLNNCMTLSKILEYWYNDPGWQEIFRNILLTFPEFLSRLTGFLSGSGFNSQLYSFESKSLLLYDFCKNHYPSVLGSLSAGWVRNGLSLKKEPAAVLRPWPVPSRRDSLNNNPEDLSFCPDRNPLLKKGEPREKYYYIIENENIHWFSFNKEIDRTHPVGYICEKYCGRR